MCIISRHGDQRVSNRPDLKKKGVRGVVDRALQYGQRCASNIILFNGYVFIFQDDVFVTVYRNPKKEK